MRKCYDLLGEKDDFDDYVSKGGHDYRPDLRLAIFGFFHKHLKRDDAKIEDADFPKIEGKDLRVFPTDADLPKDSINDKIDETFVPLAKVRLPVEPKGFAGWKLETLKQLKEKCFRAIPEKLPLVELVRQDKEKRIQIFSAEKEIAFPVLVDADGAKGGGSMLVVANPGEDYDAASKSWGDQYRKDTGFYFVVSPRGGFSAKWTTKNPPNTVERSLPLLGQTADSGRLRDVAAMLSLIREIGAVRLAGRGPAGVIAAYAALLVPGAAKEVVILDPPVSHRDGPHFLNVLRVCDIPEALGLLAPDIKLTLVGFNAKDKAFDRTAAIYKAAGVADKFKRE
jgi:hypothetical protein